MPERTVPTGYKDQYGIEACVGDQIIYQNSQGHYLGGMVIYDSMCGCFYVFGVLENYVKLSDISSFIVVDGEEVRKGCGLIGCN